MKDLIKNKETKELIKALTISGLIVTFFVVVLLNISSVRAVIGEIMNALSPFVWGGLFAIIVFKPTQMIENSLPKKIAYKTRRLLSSLISTLLIIIVIVIVLLVLVPQLIESLSSISLLITNYASNPNNLIEVLEKTFNLNEKTVADLYAYSNNLIQNGFNFVKEYIPSILSATISTFSSVLDFVIGFIICLYILIDRRSIAIVLKRIGTAFLNESQYNKARKIMYLTVDKFTGFFSGKILDSLIIGIICFVAMIFIDSDYAILISVVVGVTNIIPFFGPFIGAIPCGLILLLVNPIECLIFIIMIIILQQIDGNIIGPKILGDSVGLSSLWIIFAILIGGSLFGFFGMLLSVPVCAVIYYVIKDYIDNRLKEKGEY